jgi:hypothetical protein
LTLQANLRIVACPGPMRTRRWATGCEARCLASQGRGQDGPAQRARPRRAAAESRGA